MTRLVSSGRRKRPKSHFPERFLTAVLFIDIVGSTNRAAEMGDSNFTELMRKYHMLVRSQIVRWGGQEVDSAGDGTFAIFDLPAGAIGCAWSIARRQAPGLGIDIRAGVHVGECERQEETVRGVAVHAGARLASKARPGEILISKTTRDLIQGSRISVRDRGSHVLKGLPGRWRLFGVDEMAERPPTHEDKGMDPGVDVMLVDDHPLWREMIRRVLEHDDFSTVVAEASDAEEAVAMAQAARPDVVLMDVNLPRVSGIEATRAILLANPDTKVLVLSSSDERGDVLEAVEAGASGYMLKTSAAQEITEAVRRASAGELVFPPALSQLVLAALRNGRSPEGAPR